MLTSGERDEEKVARELITRREESCLPVDIVTPRREAFFLLFFYRGLHRGILCASCEVIPTLSRPTIYSRKQCSTPTFNRTPTRLPDSCVITQTSSNVTNTCYNCSQRSPAKKKTTKGSLLNLHSCLLDDPVGQGTDRN